MDEEYEKMVMEAVLKLEQLIKEAEALHQDLQSEIDPKQVGHG